jgi:hypothetical protein
LCIVFWCLFVLFFVVFSIEFFCVFSYITVFLFFHSYIRLKQAFFICDCCGCQVAWGLQIMVAPINNIMRSSHGLLLSCMRSSHGLLLSCMRSSHGLLLTCMRSNHLLHRACAAVLLLLLLLPPPPPPLLLLLLWVGCASNSYVP